MLVSALYNIVDQIFIGNSSAIINIILDSIFICVIEKGLIGLWFIGQKYYALNLDEKHEEKETQYIKLAKQWLNIYFSGKNPEIKIPLHFIGTLFQNEVCEILETIPYGKTMTYGEIANILAKKKGVKWN